MKRLFLIIVALALIAGCAGTQEANLKDLFEGAEDTGADQKLTALDNLGAAPAVDDELYIVDTTGPTSKAITALNMTAMCPAINTKSTGTYEVGTDNAWEKYCGIIYVTGNAEIEAPDAPTSNMSFTVIAVNAAVVTLDAYDSNEDLMLDGDSGNEITGGGNGIDSTGEDGDMAVVTYYDSDTWAVQTNGWAAGS